MIVEHAPRPDLNRPVDPITLTVLWKTLISIAEEMGTALRRTAFSEAVREGDDFSAAVFDRFGRMIAQGNFTPGPLAYVCEIAFWCTKDRKSTRLNSSH